MPDQHLVYLLIKKGHHQEVVTTEDTLLNVILWFFILFPIFVLLIQIKIDPQFPHLH